MWRGREIPQGALTNDAVAASWKIITDSPTERPFTSNPQAPPCHGVYATRHASADAAMRRNDSATDFGSAMPHSLSTVQPSRNNRLSTRLLSRKRHSVYQQVQGVTLQPSARRRIGDAVHRHLSVRSLMRHVA